MANPIAYNSGTTVSGYINTGTISLANIYDRALSGNEIKQNFEAYRGRFGVWVDIME